jgi:HEAT repeat protein
MALKSGANKNQRVCQPHITEAGFPQRTPEILNREKNIYPLMIDRLQGQGRRSEKGPPAEKSLTMEMLEAAFDNRKDTSRPAAAFLAGRCQPEAPEDQEKLGVLLQNLLNSLPLEKLGVRSLDYIEAAMSLALRGKKDTGREALLPLIGQYASKILEPYLAAFYLAQMGDPSGYPVMVDCLQSDNEHIRLMTARQLIGFKPYNGQTVGGKVVDIEGELVKLLKDPENYVNREIPYLLAEVKTKNLTKILQPVANSDEDTELRHAAQHVLEDLKAQS